MGVSCELPLRRFCRLPADVALGCSRPARFGAIDVDGEHRVVVRLLDAEVDEAGDLPKLLEHRVGDLAIVGDVRALESGHRSARAGRS